MVCLIGLVPAANCCFSGARACWATRELSGFKNAGWCPSAVSPHLLGMGLGFQELLAGEPRTVAAGPTVAGKGRTLEADRSMHP